MKFRTVVGLFICLILSTISTAQVQSTATAVPAEPQIKQILADRVDKYKQSVGIIVGVVAPQGTQVVSFGVFDSDDKRVPAADSIYEIGSISKVFTSLLLMDMVQRGEVKLDDPVQKYLPNTVHVPSRNGKQITLLDLAMHVSGLPRMPSNFTPKDPANPYADYSLQQMYDFLSSYTLTRDIGEKYEYSNLGAGLLGHALARRAGTDYETLLRTRVLRPLGMDSSAITLSNDMRAKLVPGHNEVLNRVSNWDIPTLAGAGAIRSTMSDMLKFLAANMALTKSPLQPAMQAMLSQRREAAKDNVDIAIGWHILKRYNNDIIWHNGGTGGYHSFIGFDPKRHVGVVVLSNSANDIDDIGRHVIDSRYELATLQVPKERKQIFVAPEIFGKYVGVYELAPNFALNITSDGGNLYVQATGQGRLQLFAETPTDFFIKEVDAQVTFVRNDQGQVDRLILHQNGADLQAKKVSDQKVR